MWTKAEDDQYGLLARDERMVDLAEDAIGKPIYLYSHKMTMKQPNEGGAWEWHQDFGYWYNYGCLAPEMMSIYVALDKATRENGCLQVLKGSHKLGRLNHIRENDQTNVEQEHLEAALKRFEHVYVEMEAGDALVFDGNLLHRSDANRTDTYRWGYICSYNAVENAPFKRVREYGNYEELRKVPAGSFAHGVLIATPDSARSARARKRSEETEGEVMTPAQRRPRQEEHMADSGQDRRARASHGPIYAIAAAAGARGGRVLRAARCFALFLSFATDGFLTSLNLFNVGRQISLLGIMAVGMTFVLISGEVDLSVGSTYAFAGLSTGMLIIAGWALPPALAVGVLAGAAIGLVNGLLSTYGRLPSLIATLGMLSIVRGAALILTERPAGDRQCPQRRGARRARPFEFMGQGYLFGVVPMQLVFFAVVAAIAWAVLSYTNFGFRDLRRRRQRQGGARLRHLRQHGQRSRPSS